MQATLSIPDELEAKLGKDRGQAECTLRRELSLVFYSRGWLSAGKAAEYGEMTRREFEELLAERRIERPLTVSDLEQEFEWAGAR